MSRISSSPVLPIYGSVKLIAFLVLILPNFAHSGDPCPPKSDLAPCTCSQVSLNKMSARMPGIEMTVTTPMTVASSMANARLSTLTRSLMKPRREANAVNTTAFPPPPENSSFYTVVTCNVPKTQYILEDVVTNALHRKWVDKLIVSSLPPKKEHTLVRLPSAWLKNVRVKQFEIRETVLSGDFISYNTPFQGQEQSMVWFTAKNCYLSGGMSYDSVGTVFTKGLNYLPRVEGVDFSRNHIVYIFALAFRYPPANLTTINLSYNSIQAIEAASFGSVTKLKHLDLSHNLLEGVSRAYFAAPARYLEHINLSWNHITVLPLDFFVNMPSLKVVSMRNNFLYSMPDKPWDTMWRHLTFVDVTGNFIECDCSLMWLLPILSPPEVNSTTTPAPTPLPGQTILGSCSQTQPQLFSKMRFLVNLTRSDLNC